MAVLTFPVAAKDLNDRLVARRLPGLTDDERRMVKRRVEASGSGPRSSIVLVDLFEMLLDDRQESLESPEPAAGSRQSTGHERADTRPPEPFQSNRRQALTAMAAAYARLDPAVRRLRHTLLPGAELLRVADQVRWLESHGRTCTEPRQSDRARTEILLWEPGGIQAAQIHGACSCVTQLSSTAKQLKEIYGWHLAEATTFLLCDHEPAVRDFPDLGYKSLHFSRPPGFDRIAFEVNPAATPEEVAAFYVHAQNVYFRTYRDHLSDGNVPGQAPKRARDIKPHKAALAMMAWAELCRLLDTPDVLDGKVAARYGAPRVPADWFDRLRRASPDLPERWRTSDEWKRLRRRVGVAKTAYDKDAWVWRDVRETIDLLMFRRPSRLGRSQRSRGEGE